jgi:hypothetical protein
MSANMKRREFITLLGGGSMDRASVKVAFMPTGR